MKNKNEKKVQEIDALIEDIDQKLREMEGPRDLKPSDFSEEVIDLMIKKDNLTKAHKLLHDNNLPTDALKKLLEDTDHELAKLKVNGIPANEVTPPEELLMQREREDEEMDDSSQIQSNSVAASTSFGSQQI